MTQAIDVYMQQRAEDRLWHFVTALKEEIGGFGYARRLSPSLIIVEDLFLVQQYVSTGEVDFIEGGGVMEAIEKAAADERLGDPDFIWLSWHSHNTMGAFWSSTDEDCIRQYGDQGIPNLLSIVANHKHEYRMRLDSFNVESAGLTIPRVTMDNMEYTMDPAEDNPNLAWDEEIKAAIRERPKREWKGSYTTGMGGSGKAIGAGSVNGKKGFWVDGKFYEAASKHAAEQAAKKDQQEANKPWRFNGSTKYNKDAADKKIPTASRRDPNGETSVFIPGEGWIIIDNDADEEQYEHLELGRIVAETVMNGEIDVKDLPEKEFSAMLDWYDAFTEGELSPEAEAAKQLALPAGAED